MLAAHGPGLLAGSIVTASQRELAFVRRTESGGGGGVETIFEKRGVAIAGSAIVCAGERGAHGLVARAQTGDLPEGVGEMRLANVTVQAPG